MPDLAVVVRLRELIVALDRRHAQPGRTGEAEIAREAADMRARAVRRLSELLPGGAARGASPRVSSTTRATPGHQAAGAPPPQEIIMTAPVPVRPPPSPLALSDVPADFDAAMADRWRAWQARGRADRATTRRRGRQALTAVALVAAAAAWLGAFAN